MRKRGRTVVILLLILLALIALIALFTLRARQPAPVPQPTASPAPSVTPTAQATPAPTVSPAPLIAAAFELPVEGAAGYASVSMKLRESPNGSAAAVRTLGAGTPFKVLSESGDWFNVDTGSGSGWVFSKYCLVNLPDIVPSIVYDATNTYASIIRSSGKALSGITGKGLYPGKQGNGRLGEAQFIMPVLYPMAKKVYAAQRMALQNGETLVLYEAYRPFEVQMTIVRALSKLANENKAVLEGISSAPWTLSWFASTKLSNHQRGGAIDVSLAKVTESSPATSGAYGYTRVLRARRYQMPTNMHELSMASAAFAGPVDSKSRTAWRQAAPAPAMNDAAIRLQTYCVKAGLTPLASEWWHFNDLDALALTSSNPSTGGYTLTQCLSAPPPSAQPRT
jgi:D-alanyl-D-alanine dipeptidase